MKSISYEQAISLTTDDLQLSQIELASLEQSMETLGNIRSTYFPEATPKVNEWLKFVNTPVLNLNLINGNTILGKIIISGYPNHPYETIKMICELYPDNPDMMREILSNHNCKLLNL